MKIRVKDYEVNYPPFLVYYEKEKDNKVLSEIISEFSVYSGCPLIVVICFAERFIDKDMLIEHKKNIMEFYGYEEIVYE